MSCFFKRDYDSGHNSLKVFFRLVDMQNVIFPIKTFYSSGLLFLGLFFGLFSPLSANSSAHHKESKVVSVASWSELGEGNLRFIKGKPNAREYIEKRKQLASGQTPKYIVLTCSDSRLSPELIFDKNLGELFVVRTAGNIADAIALGSMEYAVEHLGSSVLIILGHEKCGAVAAACEGHSMPSVNLEAIVKKINPAIADMKTQFSGDQLKTLAIRANIYRSSNDVIKNSSIIKEAVDAGKLQIITAIYRLDSGEVERIP